MTITIETLKRREVHQFMHLLRLGFKGEIAQRGTDFKRLERFFSLLFLANGLPLRMIRWVSGHEAFVLAAKSEDRVVGSLTVVGRENPALTGVYVLPEFRGQGTALRLVEEALVRLKTHGHHKARVAAIDENAERLAQRAGFVPCARIDLYRRALPAEIPSPPGVRIEYSRRREPTDHPYDLRFLGRLIGFRSAGITAVSGKGEAVRCTLIAQPHQTIGEIRPQLIIPGEEGALLAALATGCDWLSHLGKKEVYLPLPSDVQGLADIAVTAGFWKDRSWTHLAIDLDSWDGTGS
jgi:GNAT superfamily N-acetyltransferase